MQVCTKKGVLMILFVWRLTRRGCRLCGVCWGKGVGCGVCWGNCVSCGCCRRLGLQRYIESTITHVFTITACEFVVWSFETAIAHCHTTQIDLGDDVQAPQADSDIVNKLNVSHIFEAHVVGDTCRGLLAQ